MKRILFDVNSIVQYRGFTNLEGIGRSTLSLLETLAGKEDLPFEIVLLSQRLRRGGLEIYNLPFKQFRIPLPNQDRFKKIIKSLKIKEAFTRYDLYHIPHNTDYVALPHKTVFTIHDLMIYKFPEFFPFTKKFDSWAKNLMKECKAIITCSDSSKNDIAYYWNVPTEKISVIRWGIDRNVFFPADAESIDLVMRQLKIKTPYLLAVSTSHPRKNTRYILKSFREFCKFNSHFQLVILWDNPPKDLISEYEHEIQNKKILFINHVDDTVLRCLYSGAAATLFPSLYEGFGFPILESFACHTPVITCNNSSLREVGGNLALYTSETDISDLVMQLNVIKEGINKKSFEIEVEKHLLHFSWRTTCEQYISLYNTLLK